MNKSEFKSWVDKTVRKYNADFKALCLYRGETGEIIDENKIIVLDAKTGKTGMSRCNPSDEFNFETGLAIAYARLRNIEIPKVEEELKFKRVNKGKEYYFVMKSPEGGMGTFNRKDDDCCIDENNFKNNNYFHTEERAAEVVKKMNFLLKLERLHDIYCPNYKPDWNGKVVYYVGYVHHHNKFEMSNCVYLDSNPQVYFPSAEIAQKVCDELNEELEEVLS